MAQNPNEYSREGEPEAEAAFQIARAKYIAAYAALEQQLSSLFAHLSGTTNQVAGVIFFRISSARSRLTIIDRLMRIRYGGEYRLFFNSLIRDLKQLDQKRNEIVHWYPVTQLTDHGTRFGLTPPNIWDSGPNTQTLQVSDLEARRAECEFYSGLLSVFWLVLKGHTQGAPAALLDIYQRPVEYPPPDTHPLSPNHKDPGSSPQSSEA